MGANVSASQMAEYREVVKDRLSEQAIEFLYMKFIKAAPGGLMTPLPFKKYIDKTGAYKDKTIQKYQADWESRLQHGKKGGASKGEQQQQQQAHADVDAGDGGDMYLHLFRGYDLDGDGVITFKEFLIYHLAIMYNTEELFYVVFNCYDEDGDGYLSVGDIKSVITAATRYVGDYDVTDREVMRVIDEEARRLMAFLDIRKEGRLHKEDMRLITQKYPEVLSKMKHLM